jgi:hypothetical protein
VATIYTVDGKVISETVQCNVCHVFAYDVNVCQDWYEMSSDVNVCPDWYGMSVVLVLWGVIQNFFFKSGIPVVFYQYMYVIL